MRLAVQESAAASRFMEHDAPALMQGDDYEMFSLARCHEELAGVLALGDQLEVPLALAGRATELYAQALERYGDIDGELLAARLVAERAGVDLAAEGPQRLIVLGDGCAAGAMRFGSSPSHGPSSRRPRASLHATTTPPPPPGRR